MEEQSEKQVQWFVMRDLKRSNAKRPAYRLLQENGIEVFVPMKQKCVTSPGRKKIISVPAIPDLLFAHAAMEELDPIVAKTKTLQYRIPRNCNRQPMTVKDSEMQRFIKALESSKDPEYYVPEEITPEMCSRKIRIIGGILNGYEGFLLTVRGSKSKRLLVNIRDLFAVSVEVSPEMIQFI